MKLLYKTKKYIAIYNREMYVRIYRDNNKVIAYPNFISLMLNINAHIHSPSLCLLVPMRMSNIKFINLKNKKKG